MTLAHHGCEPPVVRGAALRTGTLAPYLGLERGDVEPHTPRADLHPGTPVTSSSPRSLLHVAHLTDVQLIDAQSPSRLEAVHALGRRPETQLMLPMQRPQELLAAHATEAMVRRLNEHPGSARTGAPLQAVLTTGDNVDNMQHNELEPFLRLLGGGRVELDSGGPTYQGPQDGSVPWAWAPDDPANVWGGEHGFPVLPGLIQRALAPFTATGLRMPWLTCFGNHDGLIQGRVPASAPLVEITLGHRKVATVRAQDVADFTGNPLPAFTDLSWPVSADPGRRPVDRAGYVAAHFDGGSPDGHGFGARNRADGTAYYAHERLDGFRVIVLDTTNPAGVFEGSIDAAQLAWLEAELAAATAADQLVLVASHHPRTSMTNDLLPPGVDDPAAARVLGEQVAQTLARHPVVIAWISGHIHKNRVLPYRAPAGGGFWEISSSSIMDWPTQARLLEVLDHGGGTLSMVLTMVDHEGPVRPEGIAELGDLAGWHRELAANDPYGVGGFHAHGDVLDRNVELLIADPRRHPRRAGEG